MSTRLDYEVTALREQIEAKFLAAVEAAHEERATTLDLSRKRDEWRAIAEQRVRELHQGLEAAADNELESFRIPSCPRVNRYDSPGRELERALKRAEDIRDSALSRLAAVKAPSGTLSLTANMLRDWFAL